MGERDSQEKQTNILNDDWKGCDVKIVGGFSSDFDMMEFHGVICNECLSKNLNNLYKVKGCRHHNVEYEYFEK